MCRGEIVLLAIVVVGVSPLSASGSADFDNNLIVDLNDLAHLVSVWLQYTTGPEDLDESGFVDLRDFSVLASEWLATTDCCADTNVSGPWQYINFTGIGDCDLYDCWMDPTYSDPCNDNCGHSAYMGCVETPEFDFMCAYNYWFAGRRVGLCVYACGRNAFQIRKNATRCRILQTIHLTRDIPPQDPECYPWGCPDCDEGTEDKYDWQVYVYNDGTGTLTHYCRESYLEPVTNNLWEPYQGEPSACELSW